MPSQWLGVKPAPKKPRDNSRYRRAILSRCNTDAKFREQVWIRCSRDFVWWCDTFAFTYDPKTHPNCPNRPFVLYGFQERASERILKALGFHDLLAEKSRQMGFTWLIIAIFVWRWLFHRGQSFLLGSRKEDLVDKPGDPSCLMYKADYILERLPGWMTPNFTRTNMRLENHDTNSVIVGESTNDNFARGSTHTAIALDEFPAVDNGHDILRATRDATHCRLMIGTPAGAAGAYYDTRVKLLDSHPDWVLTIHWTLHPEKAAGLYTTVDGEEGSELLIVDTEYEFPPDYKFIRDGKKRSPWYDLQCERAASQQEIAQEVDINYAEAGWNFFDVKLLERLKKEHCRKPLLTGEIVFKPDWKNPEWIQQAGGGRVRLWFDPDVDGLVPKDWTDVVCGVDVATGKGGDMSSSSVASFVRSSNGEKIAEFSTNQMFPDAFCLYVLALCRWFNDAYLIPEANGPGGQFVKQVIESQYMKVYYRKDDDTKFVAKSSKSIGFWTSKDSKRILLSDYAKALINGSFINRSEVAYEECGQYVHEPNGDIKHSRAKATIDPTAAGENHGDVVIADALACRGISEVKVLQKTEGPAAPPPNSFGARHLARLRRKQNEPKHLGDWKRVG